MDIKVEIQPKEIIAKVETHNEPIYGGTKDYKNLENLPSINGYLLIGEMSLSDLGIQPVGDYAKRNELPQNVSDLNNDAGYLVQSDLTDYAKLENLPTKVSQLENDSYYATKSDLPTKTSELENDSNFAYVSDIPTNVSELNNDSNYLVRSDISNLDNHVIDTDNPHKVTKEKVGLGNVDNTSDADKPLSIAQKKYIDDSYANSNAYTDQKIADLIGGAPETLDTLKEVSDAIAESKDVETALNNAIGTKANKVELDTHTGNDTIHITADERTNWNDANSKKHTHSNKSVIDKITQTLLDSWNAAYTHISDTVKHITSEERTAWNNKYAKPTNGIPKSDLASAVQTSLGKADTALQVHQDISGLATKTELTAHTNNIDNPHSVTKSQVGLGNVNNTSDKDKPISTVQKEEFDKLNSNLLCLNVLGYEVPEEVLPWYIKQNGRQVTVYGGRLDLAKVENWVKVDSEYYTDDIRDYGKGYGVNDVANAYLEGYGVTSYNGRADKNIYIVNVKPRFVIYDSSYNTVSDLMNGVKGKYLYYELATPITKTIDGNEAITNINESLEDYGLVNQFDGLLELGGIDDSGNKTTRNDCARSVNRISCKACDVISGNSTVLSSSNHAIAACFFNGTTFLSKGNITNGSVVAPNNATNFIIMIYEGMQITLSSIKVNVYVNNAIDEIKNDLAKLFSSNITGIKLNGSTLEVSFNNGTSVGKVSFEGIVEEETIIS